MLLKAAEDFDIDLSKSWMVGDSESDIKAGMAAGCNTALLTEKNLEQSVLKPTCTKQSLLDFVDWFMEYAADKI